MKLFGNKIKLLIILIFLLSFLKFFDYKKWIIKNHNISNNLLILLDNKTGNNKLIAHAGGSIDGHIYTNSMEAVNKSIKDGFKFIELDLIETSDYKLVAAHDWDHFFKITKCCNAKIPTLSEFNNTKILDKYTVLDYVKINSIFKKNKDLFLVVDKSNNFELINDLFDFDKSRIIVEIFGKKNLYKSIKNNIRNPLYSASLNHNKDEKKFIKKNKVQLIAVSKKDYSDNEDAYIELKKNGTYIFVYTVNDKNLFKKMNNNIAAIYTDFITP